MKRGFTLIELLAVIVILAIIALIAVPIVINIIKDTKESSQEESIKKYAKAIEDGVSDYYLRNPNKKEVPTIEELQQGHYLNYKGNLECEETEIYQNGKIYLSKCIVDGTPVTYTYGDKSYKKYITLVSDADGDGQISPGDKYTYQVMENMEEPYVFYVLKIEGDKVHLIQDRNICGYPDTTNVDNGKLTEEGRPCLVAWYSTTTDNSNGPVTAMQGLYNATKNWTNVPDMDLSGDNKYSDEGHEENNDYGYGEIITTELGIKITKKDKKTEVKREGNLTPVIPYETNKPLKARLPKFEEVYNTDNNDTNHCHNSAGSCPSWLTNGLEQHLTYYPNNDHISGINGYWLLSSHHGTSSSAREVLLYGNGNYGLITSSNASNGLRPVITVPKSDLE